MDTANSNVALLGDSPVLETERPDLLNYSSTARVLAEAAIATSNPLTIGVFGEWGTGKTSLMRLIQEEVAANKRAVAVWFNAWQYEKEEHLIVPLVATINKGLHRSWPAEIAEGATKLISALRAIASGFSIKGKVGIPLISEAEVNLSPESLITRYQELTKDSVLAPSLYFDAFEKLKECAGSSAAPRIVVLVDDLDRCFPDKAVALLEGIKLVLHQPGFAFVLGLNDVIIEAFIKTKYVKDYDIPGKLFEDYLDKMVQVKMVVPKRATGDMTKYIGHLLDEGKIFEENKEDVIPLIADACKHNPRSIVRLLNRIIVTSRIRKIEERPYDALALLIDITMDDGRYKDLRDELDVTVAIGTTEQNERITIGAYLSRKLETYEGNHREWAAALGQTPLISMKEDLDKAVTVLRENEHLCRVLKSETGRHWLGDSDYRGKLKASESTVGEKRAQEEIPSAAPTKPADPIGRLQQNMVLIPAGKFRMGSAEDDSEQPIRTVTLGAFEIGATPVTQVQYEAVMEDNPSYFKGPDNPVERVSWDDAIAFCKKLSERTQEQFTLPTEAQWEYACRAGSNTRYCFGDSEKELPDYAWYRKNSEGHSHPVGRKKPNVWGLYDMHGNVWEWCYDLWHGNYKRAPRDGSAWLKPAGPYRALRHGSWGDGPMRCRSASRSYGTPGDRDTYVGFRVARTP
ncbi:MAG: SUMF1/EgtB/PvdO family nonheme iron enzyme [Candidatus Hydrogenedentes bacterium]|nr:SUMF1/EgtB/PvdO family nonheme iron enzyme [Candidatus Hydrogenedentota bacterium]